MTPKVSAIITAKNEESHIEACLKSLKNQTLKNFEIIVSDGESKDSTVKIAKKYADKVVVKKTNVAAGRNVGADIASGDILVFIDADTVLLPDTMEKVIAAFKKKDIIGATCPALPLAAEAQYVGIYMFYNSFAKTSIRLRKPQIAGFFCAYRRDAFEKVGGFNEYVGILEDFDLSRRISSLGKIAFVSSALVLTSHRRLKKWGIHTPRRYMHAWLKLLLTGRSFSHEWYNSIR
jgi:glycosyltransferase involved in cell wall biosynthesis